MEQETFNNFKTILSNNQLSDKVRTDCLRTTVYSYPQSDPDVQTLMAIAAAQVPPVPLPAVTDPGAAGLADYSYATVADLQAAYGVTGSWRALDPGLANEE